MKGRAFLAFLAMLVMLVAAFAVGAYRGYFNDRIQVELALSSLSDVLQARIEMGYNLLTVARRHLPEDDALVVSVQGSIRTLEGDAGLAAKAAANAQLSRDSRDLLNKLEGMDSVQTDQRDLRYVTGLLPRGFETSAQWADAEAYNSAVREFNKRLNTTLNGRVAKLLGVMDAETFGTGGNGI